ncbi:MAG: hypothetical protein ACFFDT_03905 [Candidatus Hodarchaeota archaeon]
MTLSKYVEVLPTHNKVRFIENQKERTGNNTFMVIVDGDNVAKFNSQQLDVASHLQGKISIFLFLKSI